MLSIVQLKGIYSREYVFPDWNVNIARTSWNSVMKEARVYYDAEYPLALVQQTATEREPVNISGHKGYSVSRLMGACGWNSSFYERYFNTNRTLAPNIGIYTPSRIGSADGPIVYIYNAVGFAMDCQWQPDYQYLQTLAVKYRVLFLQNFYLKVFKKIMICAQSKNFKMLVMSLVGGGFFSQLFNEATNSGEDSFFEVVWKPTFKKAVRKYCYANSH